MSSRRDFVRSVAVAGASLLLVPRARAMQTTQSFNGPMEQDAYRPVELAARAGAKPSMSEEQRDALEHQIKCQCGCVLDVYTCRTTDFTCAVSPAMHGDVMTLVSGGYNASEILTAFQNVYGERVLMAPLREGFNLVGYIMPFFALLTGGLVVAGMIRRWGAKAQPEKASQPVVLDATAAELSAIDAAVRDEK